MIASLEPHQVFVFGSNAQGFHGAGAAGFACRGDAKNTWRQDAWFLKAMKSEVGSQDRVGKWAVYGVATGYQEGREGRSYAIQTIERPGERRSVTRKSIYYQLVELWDFVKARPNLEFLISSLGEGYSGYTPAEMQVVWDWLIKKHGLPNNIVFIGREQGVHAT